MEKLYVMRKESTTSPGGCVQVRAMEVEAGVAVSPVGEEGGMAADRETVTHGLNGLHLHSPAQDTPSPLYPWLQAQLKLPGLLVQAALGEQLSAPVAHSSMSVGERDH